MKGLKFKLSKGARYENSTGFEEIEIVERYLYRVRKGKYTDENEELADCTYYDYDFIVKGTCSDGNIILSNLSEDEFMNEIADGIYEIMEEKGHEIYELKGGDE